MKNLFTLFSLLLFLAPLNAQKNELLIKLEVNQSVFNSDFKCVEVIDNRPVKSNIGFAKIGLMEKKVPVNFDGEFSDYLKNNINKLFFGDKEKQDLVFIIHQLDISERKSTFSNKGIYKIKIEFAEYKNSTLYSLGSFYHELEKGGGGTDVYKVHGKRLLECLINCIKPFYKSDWKNVKSVPISMSEDVAYDIKKHPAKGLYSSFNHLAKSEPLDVSEYDITKFIASSKIAQYRVKGLDKKLTKKIKFISNGPHIFMHASKYCYHKHFVRAKHKGKYLYFEDKFAKPNPAVYVTFGMVGVAISNSKKGLILDTSTGLVHILSNRSVFELIKDHPDIYREFKLSKRKLEDREQAIIRLNNYYSKL